MTSEPVSGPEVAAHHCAWRIEARLLRGELTRIRGAADQMSGENDGTEGGRCLAVIAAMAENALAGRENP